MINDLDMQGWAYLLAPTFQFVNTAGKPLTEGYLEVYIAGTRNKYYCASDFNGTLHPFQIPLDSLGSNIVLADPSQAYDVYAYNRFGSLVMSRYNVSPSNAGGSGVSTITISSNDDTVQVVQDGNNYDLSIADTIARIDNIEDRIDEIGDGSVGYAVAYSEFASGGLFNLTNDKNKDIDYMGDMHGFRLKPGHVYQLNFNAKFDCNNDTNKLISGKFYIDGDNVVSQEWQFNVDNSFEHQESFNGSTVLVIPEDVSYYDVKLKYLFDDEALDLYLNKISIVDVTSIVSQGASGGGVEYTDGDGIIVDNSNHTINVDMDYINSHLDIDANSILSSAYNYTDARVSQVSGDIVNIISEVTGSLPIPEQVQSDWNQDDDTQVDYIKNKPDLDIYATHHELETTVTNVVSSVSSVLQYEIDNIPTQVQSDWEEDNTSSPAYIQHKPEVEDVEFEEINLDDYALASAIPDISNLATKNELNTVSGNIINYVDNSIDNVTNVIESVSGDLQAQIGNIPEQVNADWNSNSGKSEILNKPNLSIYATHNEVSGVSGNIINYVNEQIGDIPTQVQANWNETDSSDPSYIENKPDLSNFATIDDVNAVTSLIPEAQVQSNWTEDDTNDPSYILNKPNELELIAGNNIEIAVSGTNIVISSTASAVTGLDLLYGQFTSNNVSTTATMAKSKGNINVSDGKIQLEQGKSYHVTVRGYYQQTNAANSYSPISYVEYITSNSINIDIDRSRTDAQYFELSYDLFNLNSDIDYQVAFSGGAGLVKDLVVEVHSLGGAGTGSSGGGSAIEYDAGYGINIANQVISVDSSIIPDTSTLATKAEVSNVSGTIVGMIPNTSNLATKAELNSASANIIGQIPDVSNFATTTELTNACNNVISMIPEVPDVSNLATKVEVNSVSSTLDTKIDNAISDMATQTWVGNQGYLTSIPSNYATDDEVNTAINNATSSLATKVEVNNASAILNIKIDDVSGAIPTLPEEEEVEFEEIDLSNYALASAIPDVSNFATETYVNNAIAEIDIPEVSGVSGISVNDNVISLDNPVRLVAGTNVTIEVSGSSAIISSQGGGEDNNVFIAEYGVTTGSEIQTALSAGKEIVCKCTFNSLSSPDIGTVYLPTIKNYNIGHFPNEGIIFGSVVYDMNYNSETQRYGIYTWLEVSYSSSWSYTITTNDPLQVRANWNESNSSSKAYIQNKPDLSSYATKTELNTKQDTLTGITDVQVVQSLPVSPVSSVLYLIPEV
jgi:hypothetical protein